MPDLGSSDERSTQVPIMTSILCRARAAQFPVVAHINFPFDAGLTVQ